MATTPLFVSQAETDHTNVPVIQGDVAYLEDETIAQDAGRVAALADMTLMAKVASSGQWTPLRDVDPAATPGSMLTGAIGAVETFQAVSDGSFGIAIDGETAFQVAALDFSDIEAPTATGASCLTGALGCTLATMQAITDGEFGITVDGNALSITGLDFSDIYSISDTAAKAVCGANGTNLAGWQAVADGGFAITVDGITYTFTDMDFAGISKLAEVATVINAHAKGTRVKCAYDNAGDVFHFYSTTRGRTSTITVLAAGTTTDISGAGYLNGTSATLTQGTGGDGLGTNIADVINLAAAGRFEVFYDAATTKFLFLSPRRGAMSTITALSDPSGGGTDISDSGHLNGRTGTATLTQGTGDAGADTTIVDVINDKAAGRFTAYWSGTKIRFVSPTLGVNSAVAVLTAGTTGTDISGASYLNGLTGTGVATAGTGLDGSHLPAGIYRGGSIAAASIVAGTTTGCIVIPNKNIVMEDYLVLENSLDLDSSIITQFPMTIRDYLHSIGFIPQTVKLADANV